MKKQQAEITIEKCPSCKGVWFDVQELNIYLKSKIIINEEGRVDENFLRQYQNVSLKCPKCRVLLTRQPATGFTDMEIHRCRTCEGTWLDPEKLLEYEKNYRRPPA